MDDYDRDQDFGRYIQNDNNTKDRDSRLSRCRKQLTGGCRGLLTIQSRDGVIVRKETVALAHRSLIEFFQLPDVQTHIEEQSQGFDKLNFCLQSLIAELKLWPLSRGKYLHLFRPLLGL